MRSRSVSRTATSCFLSASCYFGVITAYVPWPDRPELQLHERAAGADSQEPRAGIESVHRSAERQGCGAARRRGIPRRRSRAGPRHRSRADTTEARCAINRTLQPYDSAASESAAAPLLADRSRTSSHPATATTFRSAAHLASVAAPRTAQGAEPCLRLRARESVLRVTFGRAIFVSSVRPSRSSP